VRAHVSSRALFGRHLDLSRLRGGRGVVACCFHRDRTPSLSVDVERGLFNCFSCGARGGVRRFAELVGEPVGHVRRAAPVESEGQSALRAVLEAERHRQLRMRDWWPFLTAMTRLRRLERAVAAVRAHAGDDERGWGALADAAIAATYVESKTCEIETIIASGRIASERIA